MLSWNRWIRFINLLEHPNFDSKHTWESLSCHSATRGIPSASLLAAFWCSRCSHQMSLDELIKTSSLVDINDSLANNWKWSNFSNEFSVNGPHEVRLPSRLSSNLLWCLAWLGFVTVNATTFEFLQCIGTMCSAKIDLIRWRLIQHSAPHIALVILTSRIFLLRQVAINQVTLLGSEMHPCCILIVSLSEECAFNLQVIYSMQLQQHQAIGIFPRTPFQFLKSWNHVIEIT